MIQDQCREQLSESAQEYVHFVIDGADRMKLLIDNLLEYSRVRSLGAPWNGSIADCRCNTH